MKIEDPFAPGYSATSASSGQLNISPEKVPKDDDYDKDSFIDDNFRWKFDLPTGVFILKYGKNIWGRKL